MKSDLKVTFTVRNDDYDKFCSKCESERTPFVVQKLTFPWVIINVRICCLCIQEMHEALNKEN